MYASHENKVVSQSNQKQEDKGILQSVGEFLSGAGKAVVDGGASVVNGVKELVSLPFQRNSEASAKKIELAQNKKIEPTPTPQLIAKVDPPSNKQVLGEADDLLALRERVAVLETTVGGFTSPSVSVLDSAGENILRNSSFEAESGGKPRQWNYQLDSTSGNTFRSDEGIRSGAYGVKFKGEGNGNFGLSQPDVKTTAGRTYTFSTYIKVVNAPKITVRVGFWDEYNNKRATMKDFTFTGTKDWSRINMKATTTGLITDSKNWFPMIEILGLTSGSVYLEDSKLEEGSVLTAYNTAAAKSSQSSGLGDGSILTSTGGDLYPAQSGVGRLGTSDNKWEDLFLSDDASIGDALSTGGDITASGDVAVNGDDLTSDGNLTIAATGYVRIGDTGTPGVATADDELYVLGDIEADGNLDIAGNITVAGTQTITGGTTISGDQTIAGDLAVNGGDLTSTATTFNLLNGTVTTLNVGGAATTFNLADSTTTKTIDIGGVTSSGTDTINISTEGTAADTVAIGNTNASTTVAVTGGDDWSMAATGILTMSASSAQTTAIVATDTDYTNALSVGDNNIIGTTGAIDYTNFDVSTGGNITVAAGVGIDTNAAGILTLGNTTATTINIGNTAATTIAVGAGGALTRTFNVGTGTGADTINIGTGGTTADAITVGDSAANVAITDANWSITGAGAITTGDDVAVNGGDLTTTAATFNLVNGTATTVNFAGAATALNIADSTTTKTIDIGGVTSSGTDTINVATEGTAADVISVGNTNAATTIALTGGDDWSMAATGILTMSASAAQTTAVVITDTDYTNALSIGDNVILGTTAGVNFDNFDVATTGNITVAGGVGIDTNAAGILTVGNTTATTVNIGNTAATTLALGAGGALTRTINVGTGTGADTINIGTGGTTADAITIGDSVANVAVTDAQWSITGAGAATLVSLNLGTTTITDHLSGTATNLVSASIATVACGNYGTITVTGAVAGDTVYASPDAASSATGIEDVNLIWNAVVTANDTVTIRACNPTVGAIDAGDDQEWRADVWKH